MNNRRKLFLSLGAGALSAPLACFTQQRGKDSRMPPPGPGKESAEGTRGLNVIDSNLDVWTIDGTNTLAKNLLPAGGGRGSEYLYHNHTVYALGTDGNYWKWASNQWVFAGADPAPVPLPEMPPLRTHLNLSNLGHYSNHKPLINWIESSSRGYMGYGAWTEKHYDFMTQEIIDLPPISLIRTGLTKIIQVDDVVGERFLTRVPSGTYFLVYPGKLSCTVSGGGTTNCRIVSIDGTLTKVAFEVPATDGALANPSIYWNIQNDTNVPQSMKTLYIKGAKYPALYHASHEAAYQAGEIFMPEWIASQGNPQGYRFMDWMNCMMFGWDGSSGNAVETAGPMAPAHFTPMSAFVYTRDWQNKVQMPPELEGRLCGKMNVDAWFSYPVRFTDAGIRYHRDRFLAAAGRNWKGTVRLEMGDEGWNVAWPWGIQMKYMNANIAPHIKVVSAQGKPSRDAVDQMGCSTAHLALKVWRIWEEVLPRQRIVRVLCGQCVATGFYGGMGGQFKYVDELTGKTAGELADEYGIAPYHGLGKMDDPECTALSLLKSKAYLKSDDWWRTKFMDSLVQLKAFVVANRLMLSKAQPNLKLTTYEGGGWPEIPLNTNRFPFVVDSSDPTLLHYKGPDTLNAYFGDGELVKLGINQQVAVVQIKGAGTMRLRFKEAGVSLTAGEKVNCDNYTRILEFHKVFDRLMNGEFWDDITKHYVDDCLQGNVTLYNQFQHEVSGVGLQQGLVANQFLPPTPIVKYFAKLGR